MEKNIALSAIYLRLNFASMCQRRCEAAKLAPIVMESPQLQQGFCAFAGEDLQCKAGQKVLRVYFFASKENGKYI